ncbi:MAG: hypothetical protein ABI324_28035 [Ktedonobacteraceae bacterium]
MKMKWLTVFFWFTFGAFLAPSIPHIAYFFHAWEPQDTSNPLTSAFWWLVSYAIAVSIDGTVIWLTKTAVIATREQASGTYKFWLWTFIAFLTALSFQINQWYAIHHLDQARVTLSGAIDEQMSLAGFATLRAADLMPIVASLFPVLAIMFMVMADKITGVKPEMEEVDAYSAEAFEKKLRRIQQDKTLKEAAQGKSIREQLEERVIGKKSEVIVPIQTPVSTGPITDPLPLPSEIMQRSHNQEELPVPLEEELLEYNEPITLPEMERIPEANVSDSPENDLDYTVDPLDASSGLPARGTMTIDDVARSLGKTVKQVQYLLSSKQLKRASRNKQRVLVASVIAYAKLHQNSDAMPAIIVQTNSAENGHSNGHTSVPFDAAQFAEVTAEMMSNN